MRILRKYVELVDRFSEFLGKISMYLVIITVAVGFLNVVLRYLGRFVEVRLTSNFFIELQWYLYSLIFFFGFAYILKNNINVRVDFWYGQQGPRTKAWIDLVGHFVALIPYTLMGIWVTWGPVLTSWGRRPDGSWGTWEQSPDPSGLPRAPIKSMIIVAFITLLIQGTVEIIRLIAFLRNVPGLAPEALKEHEAPLRIE
ncbi:MAG: TRAP transporter small permease subunit [Caldilineae bacterium]|nr:MAG: TRAP transporter small permease subunit [Caldilineae bacterium]